MKLIIFKQFARLAMSAAVVGFAQGAVAAESATTTPYLLSTCPVSGSDLGSMGDPISKVYDGKEVKFCCGGCPAKYEADRAKYDAEIDAKLVEAQTPYYPLDTCVVSGEKLGEMGKPVDIIDGNTLVRLCCKGCVPKFDEKAEQYRETLNQAVIKNQKDGYPLETCFVSGEKLGGAMGDPVEYVVGNRLLRLCCKECIKEVAKDPAAAIQKLDQGHQGDHAADASQSENHSVHQHGAGSHE